MKFFISICLVVGVSYGLDLELELEKCSSIKVPQSRLMCYDVITSQIIKPTPLEEKGSKLTNECYHCHGGMWELTQRVGSKPVKDMTKDEITKALYGYKDKNYGDNLKDVMENQVRDLGKEDIDTIVEYILYKRDK